MKKKSLILLLCAAMTLGSVAFGTIAYLTDRQAVANTFTVGDVNIKVDEQVVLPDGTLVDEDQDGVIDRTEGETGNTYHLIPGKSYVKDPTMTVLAGSEACYARMAVTVTHAKELAAICADMTAKDPEKYPFGLPQDHVEGFDPAIWVWEKTEEDTENNLATYYFRYHKEVEPQGGDVVLKPIFTKINVPGLVSGEQLKTIANFQIIVEGQAIQTAAFEDADEAWNAFAKQTTPVTEEEPTEDGETTEGDETTEGAGDDEAIID